MRMHEGTQSLMLPQAFAAAKRIILHAAIYGPFVRSAPHRQALETAVRNGAALHAILAPLPSSAPQNPWINEFWQMVRPGVSLHSVEQEWQNSIALFRALAATATSAAAGATVLAYATQAMPCLPVLLADDRIFFGHYAHSAVPAPQGVWCAMDAPVGEMLAIHSLGTSPVTAGNTQTTAPGNEEADSRKQPLPEWWRAPARLVEECVHAMHHATRIPL